MPAAKRTPERKSRSGSYVHEAQRGAKGGLDERITIRCTGQLAAWVRRVAREHGYSLAEILEAGADAVAEGEATTGPTMTTTQARDEERACRADAEYERMRDER